MYTNYTYQSGYVYKLRKSIHIRLKLIWFGESYSTYEGNRLISIPVQKSTV